MVQHQSYFKNYNPLFFKIYKDYKNICSGFIIPTDSMVTEKNTNIK